MAWEMYEEFILGQHNGNAIDLDDNATTTIKLAILNNTHTKALYTDIYWSDVSAEEVSGTNYTAGGFAIANRTCTANGSGTITFDGDDISAIAQSASGFSNGRYLVLYKDTGTPTTSQLIAIDDMSTDKGNTTGSFQPTFNSSGIFTVA